MAVIKVDGYEFDVGIISIQRKARVLDGNNTGNTLSGRMIRDIIGTYYDYTVSFGTSKLSAVAYDALYELLTAPIESHSITVPYGQSTKTFNAYITEASDTLKSMSGSVNTWGSLSLDFTAMEPMRMP